MQSQQSEWTHRYSAYPLTEPLPAGTILAQLYVNTYMYHYREEDILLGKPWEVNKYQVQYRIHLDIFLSDNR